MANTLDIIQLRTFAAIADCGGFGRAATALHLSQSTVSQHVRLLERRLGSRLVRLEGRRTRFTPTGEALLIEARRILSVHDEALARLDATHDRSIVLGSTETAAEQILPEMLRELRAVYPDRPVQFRIERSTQMIDAVDKGTIDLAIVLDVDSSAAGAEVGSLPLNWYSAPGKQLPDDAPVPLVAYIEPCGMRRRALQELGGLGKRVEITAESGSLEGVIAAARAGLGVAVLPTAGPAPSGLVIRRDLPDLGRIYVRLLSRRGLDTELESSALGALTRFFSAKRHLQAV
ncbi:LysR family transcriptional regulator [Rathayibacter sp. KR2-224]|uniref:LysR family transcriptional regulator n=1 Tax=Rathayibacter sp. KR2-224 TaxID=3400913 RepID=UPI003C103B72